MAELIDNKIIDDIRIILEDARHKVSSVINTELLTAYWNIGKLLCEYEKSVGKNDEKMLMSDLSKRLTTELGKGFSRSNLFNMKKFYLIYPAVQTLSGLSWSHYCELLSVDDADARKFYENETINSNLS